MSRPWGERRPCPPLSASLVASRCRSAFLALTSCAPRRRMTLFEYSTRRSVSSSYVLFSITPGEHGRLNTYVDAEDRDETIEE